MLHTCPECGNTFIGRSTRVYCSRACYAEARLIDETGNRYGYLVVLKRAENGRNGRRWLCQCDCGNKTTVERQALNGGQTSCGCVPVKRGRGWSKLPKGQAARNRLLYTYQRGAKLRGIKWALTDEQFFVLTKQDCYFCGLNPRGDQSKWRGAQACNGTYIYSGVDRLDNNLGYTAENCVPCCKWCNRAKNARSSKEFLEHTARIYRHQLERQSQSQRIAPII